MPRRIPTITQGIAIFFWLVFFLCAGVAFAIVVIAWQETLQEIVAHASGSVSEDARLLRLAHARRRRPAPRIAKGIYLTAYSAGNSKKMDSIISLVDKTELNAVVIDIKDYSGYVLYDSRLPLVTELSLRDNRLGDVSSLVKRLHQHGIYVIARQTVFQDPVLAERRQAWAIHRPDGSIWRDRKGLAWVDPTRRDVWEYNLAIAKEIAGLGFDEINFDYVRFPSDGDLKNVVYTTGDKKRYEVMREFYHFLNLGLVEEPVWTSFDLFGFVMEKTGEDDLRIGQRLQDAVDEVDYISPMMYPSHYPSGHLGLKNPASQPAEVIRHGLEKGMPAFAGHRAKIRPWLQAFHLGAVYDAEKIRAQIAVVEEYPNAGWLLWNAANRYTDAGLRSESAVSSRIEVN